MYRILLYKKAILFSFISFVAIGAFGLSCRPQTNEYIAAMRFFESPQFQGHYPNTLPLYTPDSAMVRIKAEVPTQWQGLACELSFFTIPNNLTDSACLAFLDACDRHFKAGSIRAFTQMMRGRTFTNQLQYDTALICLKEAYTLSEKAQNLPRMADIKTYLARLAMQRSNYPEAIRLYREAYDIFKPLTPSDGGRYMELMLSLGKAFRAINDHKSAYEWHQIAWKEAIKDSVRTRGYQIQFVTAMAEDHLNLRHLDSARIMIDSACRLAALYQNPYLASDRYRISGLIQIEAGQCEVALQSLYKALKLNTDTDKPKVVSRYHHAIGKGYQCLGKNDSALTYYQKALFTPDTAQQAVIYKDMASMYEQEGTHQQAFVCERKSLELHQQTFTTEKDIAIGRAQVQKDAEDRLLRIEAAHRQSRLRFIMGIAFLLAGLGISLFWLYQYKKRQQTLAAEKERLLILQQFHTAALNEAKADLAHKEKSLVEKEQLLNLKNVFIDTLKMQLTQAMPAVGVDEPYLTGPKEETDGLVTMRLLTTDDWLRFRELFEQRFPDFILRLNAQLPKLSASEVRIFLLLKIGFNATEIAHILGISYKSVYTSRYRLRQKIDLKKNEDLDTYIQNF